MSEETQSPTDASAEAASKQTVIIEMIGGVIQDVINPNPNLEVIVVDYDTEGEEPEEISVLSVNEKEVDCRLVVYGSTDPAASADFVAIVLDGVRRRYGG